MEEEDTRKSRALEGRCEWAVIKRERATGKIIKTVALDADMDSPEGVTNFSEYIRGLIKQDLERRKQGKPTAAEAAGLQAARVELTEAEELIFNLCRKHFREYGCQKFGNCYEYFQLQPEDYTLLALLGDVYDLLKISQKQGVQPDRSRIYEEAIGLIQNVKQDEEAWHQLYNRFSLYWRQENPVPKEFFKEVLRVEQKTWTRYEILEKCMPERDEDDKLSVRKIAEIFGVAYQIAYNKIVPVIKPILADAGAGVT